VPESGTPLSPGTPKLDSEVEKYSYGRLSHVQRTSCSSGLAVQRAGPAP